MATIDTSALYKLSYGLFILTAREAGRDVGCVINTAAQLTSAPPRLTLFVNKQNYTNQAIQKSGLFNVNVLTQSAPFSLFQNFGFQSSRDVDKFAALPERRGENGLRILPQHVNAVLSGKVVDALDYGTHTLFVAELTGAAKLGDEPSLTYDYYFQNIKPKPEKKTRRGFVCKICGYFHEGEELPPDFICPLCKHGAEDFQPVGF